MIALGIDPGTAICGYGFVESRGSRLIPHAYGPIFTSPKMKMEARLMKIADEPDALAIAICTTHCLESISWRNEL